MKYEDVEKGMKITVTHGVLKGYLGTVEEKSKSFPTLAGTASPPVVIVKFPGVGKNFSFGKAPEQIEPAGDRNEN